MGTRGRVDTSPVAQGCPRGLKLGVQYESHTSSALDQRSAGSGRNQRERCEGLILSPEQKVRDRHVRLRLAQQGIDHQLALVERNPGDSENARQEAQDLLARRGGLDIAE